MRRPQYRSLSAHPQVATGLGHQLAGHVRRHPPVLRRGDWFEVGLEHDRIGVGGGRVIANSYQERSPTLAAAFGGASGLRLTLDAPASGLGPPGLGPAR